MEEEEKSPYSFSRLISGPETLILEHRIFNTAASVFFIVSTGIALTALVTDSELWMKIALSVISIGFLLILYYARYKKGFFISSRIFVLFTLIFNDLAWCWSVALSPAANYFFVLIVVLDLTILKVKDHLGFMAIAVTNLFLVDFLAYSYPHIFLNHYELVENITFPFRGHARLASLVLLIAVVLFFFKKNYEQERTVSRHRSRQLMNANTALDHRNQHLESMARMVSHNLRSPVAGLKMIMQLYDRMETPEQRDDLVKNMQEGGSVLFEMVDDLSTIMMDYRELIKDQEQLDLNNILRTAKKQLAPQLRQAEAIVDANFTDCPTVIYSRVFLESIFLNLISNSIKYSKPQAPPVIKIRSYVDGDIVMLSFSDNGIGIDLKEHREKMFNMYKTFHNIDQVESRGIGLFMTKNQVEMMGGKIDVESEPGQGTSFFLELYRL